MNINYHKFPVRNILSSIQHYDAKKYWKRRAYVINKGGNRIIKLYYLTYIKRCDAFNKASMGTDINHGAEFGTVPKLPHGLNGIVISPDAHIGKNCTIFHQVTIGNDYIDVMNTPTIGDNVVIYPGAKIVGRVKIGDNAVIGANCVVVHDVPDNALVVLNKPRIILKDGVNNEL